MSEIAIVLQLAILNEKRFDGNRIPALVRKEAFCRVWKGAKS